MKRVVSTFFLLVLLLLLVRSAPYAVPPLSPSNYGFPVGGEWIPAGYYGFPSIIPADMPLERWLGLVVWADEYEADAFDCSQMAAFLEWVMDNAGYKARMFAGCGHCWLSIKIDGVWIAYETTSLSWKPEADSHPQYYKPTIIFANLHDTVSWYQRAELTGEIQKGTGRLFFIQEFQWWRWIEEVQEDKEC